MVFCGKEKNGRHIIIRIASGECEQLRKPRDRVCEVHSKKACTHSQRQCDHANDCQRLHDPGQSIVDIRHIDVSAMLAITLRVYIQPAFAASSGTSLNFAQLRDAYLWMAKRRIDSASDNIRFPLASRNCSPVRIVWTSTVWVDFLRWMLKDGQTSVDARPSVKLRPSVVDKAMQKISRMP
jgi:hypothetical protein